MSTEQVRTEKEVNTGDKESGGHVDTEMESGLQDESLTKGIRYQYNQVLNKYRYNLDFVCNLE